jgi:hypothetical protein
MAKETVHTIHGHTGHPQAQPVEDKETKDKPIDPTVEDYLTDWAKLQMKAVLDATCLDIYVGQPPEKITGDLQKKVKAIADTLELVKPLANELLAPKKK